jgi:hypothetical protein
MVTKTDLVSYCLGAIVSQVKGDGNFVATGSNDPSSSANGSHGNGKTDAASLMLQAVQAIAEQSANNVDLDVLEEGAFLHRIIAVRSAKARCIWQWFWTFSTAE